MATYAAFKHVELYNVGSGKRRLVGRDFVKLEMREKSSRRLGLSLNCIAKTHFAE